jgi:Ca2+-binding EF-hand superfamily protein
LTVFVILLGEESMAGALNLKISEDVQALIPEPKLTAMIQSFSQLDSDQDGKIALAEFLDISLMQERSNLTKKFARLDRDQDGFIDFEEFVTATEPTYLILKRFRELDLNHDNLLSLDEAVAIADRLVLPLSSDQVKSIMVKVDRDGDGYLTYYEYLGAITHTGFQ